MTIPLDIDPAKSSEEIVMFFRQVFAKAGFTNAVIGLSGGVDSATSCALVVRALGAQNVFPLLLPCGKLHPEGLMDAKMVIKTLAIPDENVLVVDVAPFVDPIVAYDTQMDQVRRGNVMARARMIVLFDQAKKRHALVVGTENKSEHLLGYFTRFGDEASDIEPISHLYKTQVYALARFLEIPQTILESTPTAGLWDGQTDEGEFGFTYKQADEILHLLYDQKKSKETIISQGYAPETVEKVLQRIASTSFKHELPYALVRE